MPESFINLNDLNQTAFLKKKKLVYIGLETNAFKLKAACVQVLSGTLVKYSAIINVSGFFTIINYNWVC
jgi:hypothetical protein